jgi:PEP-CTERM motif
MKSCSRLLLIAAFLAIWIIGVTVPAFADTYHTATFTGHINPGGANVKVPFNSVLTQGGPISGNFVIDDQKIPGPGSGFVNVSFSSFPDIANIPAATAFTINLGAPSLIFTLASAIQNSGAIQFNNGQFVGFFFDADFMFTDNNPYRFDDQGGSWTIKLLDQIGGSPVPLTSAKVSGRIDSMAIGDVYNPGSPTTAVPEPATMLLLGSGLLGLWGAREKLKK